MLFKRIVSRDWAELEMISEDRSGFLVLLGHIFTLFYIDFMFNIQSGSKSNRFRSATRNAIVTFTVYRFIRQNFCKVC